MYGTDYYRLADPGMKESIKKIIKRLDSIEKQIKELLEDAPEAQGK